MQKSPLQFLFLDDSKSDNFLTLSTIEIFKLPIKPVFHTEPDKALEYLELLDISDFPDVIILDMNMPRIDGFEFVRQYTERLQHKHPEALLFMTSSSLRSSDIQKANQLPNVSAFLQKPFTPDSLETIKHHLVTRRSKQGKLL